METGGVVGTRTIVLGRIAGQAFQATAWKNDWMGEDNPSVRDFVFIDLGVFLAASKIAAIVAAIEKVYEGSCSVGASEVNFQRPSLNGRIDFGKVHCVTFAVARTNAPFEERIQSLLRRMEPLFGRIEIEVIKRKVVAQKRDDGRTVYAEVD